MVDLCKNLGLNPIMESGSGHYKVRDPSTGVYLFGISSSPSDPNFKWMIRRHLRRLGLLRETKKQDNRRRRSAIDLAALKKAQDAAISRGERPPTLDDLEDSTEFFTKIKTEYTEAAMEEVLNIMKASDAPRVNATRQRLRKLLETRGEELIERGRTRLAEQGKRVTTGTGKGAKAEFIRIAINEVAPKRGLRAWKTEASGQQSIGHFLENDSVGMQMWAIDLLDATMDHIDGLKWGEIDESRKRVPESQFSTPIEQEVDVEPIDEEARQLLHLAPEPEPISPEVVENLPTAELTFTVEDNIRERYAETLLEILRSEGSKTDESVLIRLDKLAGIS